MAPDKITSLRIVPEGASSFHASATTGLNLSEVAENTQRKRKKALAVVERFSSAVASFTATGLRTAGSFAGSAALATSPEVLDLPKGAATAASVMVNFAAGLAIAEKFDPVRRIREQKEKHRAHAVLEELKKNTGTITIFDLDQAIPHIDATESVITRPEANAWLRNKRKSITESGDDSRPIIVRTLYEVERRDVIENEGPFERTALRARSRKLVETNVQKFMDAQLLRQWELGTPEALKAEVWARWIRLLGPATGMAGFTLAASEIAGSRHLGFLSFADDIPTITTIGLAAVATWAKKFFSEPTSKSAGEIQVIKLTHKNHGIAKSKDSPLHHHRQARHIAQKISSRQ